LGFSADCANTNSRITVVATLRKHPSVGANNADFHQLLVDKLEMKSQVLML
jgi:hypothetical protein